MITACRLSCDSVSKYCVSCRLVSWTKLLYENMAHRFFRPIYRGMRRWPYWAVEDARNLDALRLSSFFELPWSNNPFAQMEKTLRSLPRLMEFPRLDYELDVTGSTATDKESVDVSKQFVTFNCPLPGFKPGDIKVKTMGRKVIVEALREEKHEADGCYSVTQKRFQSSMTLPDDADTDNVTSSLSEGGVLRITAPRLAITSEESTDKETPIAVEKGDVKQESNTESQV